MDNPTTKERLHVLFFFRAGGRGRQNLFIYSFNYLLILDKHMIGRSPREEGGEGKRGEGRGRGRH